MIFVSQINAGNITFTPLAVEVYLIGTISYSSKSGTFIYWFPLSQVFEFKIYTCYGLKNSEI